MKKRKTVLICVFIISLGILMVLIFNDKSSIGHSIEHNIGVSYLTSNNGEVMEDIDDTVPTKEELIRNLENEGYTIVHFDSVFDSSIKGDRIYCEKDGKFIDICYGLTDIISEKAFEYYKEEYKEFYLLARNTNYVYCISDKKTFKKAGFKSLANIGEQYIYN